ncbi:MAG TPA: VIT1/CCC1 transporter family protein [Kineosporiaceae bacterium]|nr:VIT1/CCC1 transporter family protein [Kineosporiaceae bacterium]
MLTFFSALNPAIEEHSTGRMQWLRASVLGANDGLVSISSIMLGVAASGAGTSAAMTAGVAGVAAGAMAMAAGEYVSVSSQADVERADRALETKHLAQDPEGELQELADIYRGRGLPADLATKVALALHEVDPLEAHLRDELGHTETSAARPVQAAFVSAGSYLSGGLVPFLGLLAPDATGKMIAIVLVTILGLAVAGMLGARAAGTPMLRPALRVVLGGSAAMAITSLVGQIAGVAV